MKYPGLNKKPLRFYKIAGGVISAGEAKVTSFSGEQLTRRPAIRFPAIQERQVREQLMEEGYPLEIPNSLNN